MPWYYAGPDAKPVGPLSVEELHERRVSGGVGPDTFVIEHTGPGAANLAWKRYKDVFPTNLPPTPPVPSTLPPLPPGPTAPGQPAPLYPYGAPTNSWCAWGFGIGLVGFFLSPVCGIGLLPALVSLVLCLIGLAQVNKDRSQVGKGLAIAGLVLSGFALLIALIFLGVMAVPMIKAHELTVTEQTSNDSE